MSVGTVTGTDHAPLDESGPVDPYLVAALEWLQPNGGDAGSGQPFAPDAVAPLVARRAAPGDARAAALSPHALAEAMHSLGRMRVSGTTPDRIERDTFRYWDIVVALAVRTVRQRLALFNAPASVVQRSLGVRPAPTARLPRNRSRVRTSGQRRRRSGRVRCGSPPGREGDPDPPDVDDAVALVLLLAGLGLPPNSPSGGRVAFETFRPGWPSAVRSVLFGLLSDSAQAAYWADLRLRVGEAA